MYSNIFIGGLRIDSLADVAYQGDVTYGIGTTLMWAIAQISTGIIVACLPHLRPLFECILPHRFTHLSTRRSRPSPRPSPGPSPRPSHGPTPKPPSRPPSKISQLSQNPVIVLVPPRVQSRSGSIKVTTDITVERSGHLLPPPTIDIHDGQIDPGAPTFYVEQGPARHLRFPEYCCGGSSGGCVCPC
jgi:hypothetical protein